MARMSKSPAPINGGAKITMCSVRPIARAVSTGTDRTLNAAIVTPSNRPKAAMDGGSVMPIISATINTSAPLHDSTA